MDEAFLDKIRVNLPLSKMSTNRDELHDWAKNNFRYYDFKDFKEHLFEKSPRELEDKKEISDIFNLFKKKTIRKGGDRIDYFLSHSWNEGKETAVKKYSKLDEFKNSFYNENGRLPRIWFDKVCIDQSDPDMAIAVLPLNVAMCKGFLLLLTDSYLRRLWCIWELFSLFIFTKKEIAIQRLHIIVVNSEQNSTPTKDKKQKELESLESLIKQIEKFDIDNAHCFDPNEELKLRKILYNIGEKQLGGIKDEIIRMLEIEIKAKKHAS